MLFQPTSTSALLRRIVQGRVVQFSFECNLTTYMNVLYALFDTHHRHVHVAGVQFHIDLSVDCLLAVGVEILPYLAAHDANE